MFGPYLLVLLIIYLLIALLKDIMGDFTKPETNISFILKILYFIPKLIPLILIGSFFILAYVKR